MVKGIVALAALVLGCARGDDHQVGATAKPTVPTAPSASTAATASALPPLHDLPEGPEAIPA